MMLQSKYYIQIVLIALIVGVVTIASGDEPSAIQGAQLIDRVTINTPVKVWRGGAEEPVTEFTLVRVDVGRLSVLLGGDAPDPMWMVNETVAQVVGADYDANPPHLLLLVPVSETRPGSVVWLGPQTLERSLRGPEVRTLFSRARDTGQGVVLTEVGPPTGAIRVHQDVEDLRASLKEQ